MCRIPAVNSAIADSCRRCLSERSSEALANAPTHGLWSVKITKRAAFQHITKMKNCTVNCQQLSIECTVVAFRRRQLPGEETERLPVAAPAPLLQNRADCG
jgi:hypothetical protein